MKTLMFTDKHIQFGSESEAMDLPRHAVRREFERDGENVVVWFFSSVVAGEGLNRVDADTARTLEAEHAAETGEDKLNIAKS